MSAKEIIINLIDRKILSGEEAYAIIEAIVKKEAYKNDYYNPYNHPLVYWGTEPYTVTCKDTTSFTNDSVNSASSTSFNYEYKTPTNSAGAKLKYVEPTVSTLDLK